MKKNYRNHREFIMVLLANRLVRYALAAVMGATPLAKSLAQDLPPSPSSGKVVHEPAVKGVPAAFVLDSTIETIQDNYYNPDITTDQLNAYIIKGLSGVDAYKPVADALKRENAALPDRQLRESISSLSGQVQDLTISFAEDMVQNLDMQALDQASADRLFNVFTTALIKQLGNPVATVLDPGMVALLGRPASGEAEQAQLTSLEGSYTAHEVAFFAFNLSLELAQILQKYNERTISIAQTAEVKDVLNDFLTQKIPTEGLKLSLALELLERSHPALIAQEHDIVEAALSGLLGNLDPHSSFFDEQQVDDMNVQSGDLVGIGVEILNNNHIRIEIDSVLPGSPAEKAKLRQGDVITEIDGKPAGDINNAISKIRGAKDTPVTIQIERPGSARPIIINMIREPVRTTVVSDKVVGNGTKGGNDIGYIRLGDFMNQYAPDDIEKAVTDLKAKLRDKDKGYIIDLRGNPGGNVEIVREIADDFLNSGEIVHSQARHPEDDFSYQAHPGDITDGKPIVVLADDQSASAAEILTGALQGNHRAIVVGTQTYGKGSVQTVYPYPQSPISGTKLHFTTALYFTPAGSIQGIGITPNIQAEIPGMPRSPREADNQGMLANPNRPGIVMKTKPDEICRLRADADQKSLHAQFGVAVMMPKTGSDGKLVRDAQGYTISVTVNLIDVQELCAIAVLHGKQSPYVTFSAYSSGSTVPAATPVIKLAAPRHP
jgi:carboxyl-terminal processing protease